MITHNNKVENQGIHIVHPAWQRRFWIPLLVIILGIVFIVYSLINKVIFPDYSAYSSSNTPFVNEQCRIAIFTYDGTLAGSFPMINAGAIASYLNLQGNIVIPFSQEEVETISDTFAARFDVVILTNFYESYDISGLIDSGLPVITTNPGYVDELGLGTGRTMRKDLSMVEVVNNLHSITNGYKIGIMELEKPMAAYAIDSRLSTSESLIIKESTEQTIMAVNKSKPYIWFGLDGVSEASKYGVVYELLNRTTEWACETSYIIKATAYIAASTQLSPTTTKTPTNIKTVKPSITPTINITSAQQSPSNTPIVITATEIDFHIPGNLYKNDTCGISFEYPLKWIIDPVESLYADNYPCFFGLKPENYSQFIASANYCMGEYAAYVSVLLMDFENAARFRGFVNEGGKWFTSGRQGLQQPAEMITARGLTILRGRFFTSIYDKKCQGYIGIGENDVALINAGGNKTVSISDESTAFQLHFEYLLQTISFLS